jgi:hypothetical protein
MMFCGRWPVMMMSKQKLVSKLMTIRSLKVNASQNQDQ